RLAKLNFKMPDFASDDPRNIPPVMSLLIKGTAQTVQLSTVRTDCGSSTSYKDKAGHTWSADTGFTGATTATMSADPTNTTDPALIRKYRKGKSFTYAKKVVNGTYKLTLYFAEPTQTAAGKRKFTVTCEKDANGKPIKILTDFDVFAAT